MLEHAAEAPIPSMEVPPISPNLSPLIDDSYTSPIELMK